MGCRDCGFGCRIWGSVTRIQDSRYSCCLMFRARGAGGFRVGVWRLGDGRELCYSGPRPSIYLLYP